MVLTKLWRFLKTGNSQSYLHDEDDFQNIFLIFGMKSDVQIKGNDQVRAQVGIGTLFNARRREALPA